jgi:glycine/D-amino acid oxidase-like deaminating enzyme
MPATQHDRCDVAVLGAGLTGCSTALALARAGVAVTVLERDDRPMNRASLRNEGKIHLGFVFSQDRSLASSRLQLQGALRFRQLLAPLTDGRVDGLRLSHPFVYLVPADSIASPSELEERFAAIDASYRVACSEDETVDYFGRRPPTLWRRQPLPALSAHIRTERFIGAFATEEVAVDTGELAAIVREAVAAAPRLTFHPGHRIESVVRESGGFRIEGTNRQGAFALRADQVVNALWENRLKIDRTVGMEPDPGWLHRLKYRVIARLPERMRTGPSTTLVVGPYGDVVVRADGTGYFSWYPRGLRGWTEALTPPDDWDGPCRGELRPGERTEIARALLDEIEQWYPGAARAQPLAVDAGAIVAYGRTDVDDPASGLHDRNLHVGIRSLDGFHSVDPGKLTTAPYFGVRAAQTVLGERLTV